MSIPPEDGVGEARTAGGATGRAEGRDTGRVPTRAPSDLEELLTAALLRQEEGDDTAVAALLAEHPELAGPLQALRGMGLLQDDPGEAPLGGRVGGHRLLRPLGEGGMGVVWLAIQESVGRPVALKLMRPELSASPAAAERFRREAQAVARIDHPHVVALHDAGQDRGVLWTAMALVPGRGLDELLTDAGQRPGVQQVVTWGAQLARALEAAHAEGVIHRDVKPANVRITPDGRALLLDFGLARDEAQDSLTRSGAFHGSPAYAAPEQIRGERRAIGPATDVHALGVLLYEALSGRTPFEGDTTEAVFHQVLTGTPPPLRRVAPGVSRDLATVVGQALERDPARRYASAAALAGDLEALLALRPVSARPPGAVRRLGRWLAAHRLAALALLALLLAAGAFAVAGSLERRREADRRQGQALAALDRAREGLDQLAAERPALAELARAVRAVAEGPRGEAVERSTWRERDGRAAELAERERVRALQEDAIQRDLDSAGRLAPELTGRTAALGLELVLERWRLARAAGRSERAEGLAAELARLDGEGRHTRELQARGRLRVTADGDDAVLRLYRAVRRDRRVPGAAPRLVWEPVDRDGAPRPLPRAPGTWSLRPVTAVPPLQADDRVVAVAGQPVEGGVFVDRGDDPIPRGSRLLAVGEHPVEELYDATHRWGSGAAGPDPTWRFVTSTGERTRRAATLDDLGLTLTDARGLVAGGAVAVQVLRDGRLVDLRLDQGLETVPTAAPLLAAADPPLALADLGSLDLPEGDYLALLRVPGGPWIRRPLTLTAGADLELAVDLEAASRPAPAGFVPVAGPLDDVDTPFWIQRHEVTCAEYLAFLNRPESAARINAAAAPVLYPRLSSVPERGASFFPLDAEGWFQVAPPLAPGSPVMGIDQADALAYAAWKSETTPGWRFDLPSLAEIDAVRRACPSRSFPWGDTFRAVWLTGWASRAGEWLAPVLTDVVDETAHGVFNLAGGVSEWTRTPGAETNVLLVGGSFTYRQAELFDNTSFFQTHPATCSSNNGFRLVARPDP